MQARERKFERNYAQIFRDPHEISYFHVDHYVRSKVNRFSFQIKSKQFYIRLATQALSNEFFHLDALQQNILVWNVSRDQWNGFNLVAQDKETLIKMLELLHRFDPLDDYTRMEITFLHDLNLISDKEIQDKFGRFLQIAKNLQSPEWLWHFIQRCASVHFNDIPKLIACYQSVQPHEPNYQEANDEMLHVLLRIPATELAKSDQIALLENKFLCSLRSGDTNKTLSLKFYHELCGNTGLESAKVDLSLGEQQLLAEAKQKREAQRPAVATPPTAAVAPPADSGITILGVFAPQASINTAEVGKQHSHSERPTPF